MLIIKQLIVGQLSTNCYLVYEDKSSQALIIDPGDDADYIIRTLSDLQVKPKAIVATHGHFDHILAVTELKLAYTIPFMMNKKDEFLLARMQDSAKFFTESKENFSPKIDKYLKNKLVIGHLSFDIIHTPGHTPGSLSFYFKKYKILFCGDLAFARGVGRTDFTYSSEKDLKLSLDKILKLPSETRVLSGHGEETTIKKIKMYNKY